jgi:hypothetical protein
MSHTPGRYSAEQVRRFSDTTIGYYDRFARAFWNGTRDHARTNMRALHLSSTVEILVTLTKSKPEASRRR